MSGLVTDGFCRIAAEAPDKTALSIEGEAVTYGALFERASRVAAAVDVCQARRVAVALPNGIAFVECVLGAVLGGATVLVMDHAWPVPMRTAALEEHAPHVIFAAHTDGTPLDANVVSLAEYPSWREAQPAGHAPRSRPSPDMPFLIGFTSGSSGRPKAFIRTHASWTESFRLSALELGTAETDRLMAPGPLCHGLSLYAVLETLNAGGTVSLCARFDAVRVLADIARARVNVLCAVPTILDVLLDAAGRTVYPSVQRIVTSGAKLPPSLRTATGRAFPNAAVIEYYGASELSFVTIAKDNEDVPLGSVGRAFAGVEIDVRDATGKTCEVDEPGVVWVKSGMLSFGYVGRAEGPGFRLEDGWATVGDLGHLDSRGFLTLDGREGSAMTTAGYTLYPAAVEAALLAYPAVAEVVVLGLADARWSEVVAAAVRPKTGADLSVEDLQIHCAGLLPRYAVPRRWEIVSDFERTASGKPDKVSVRKLFADPLRTVSQA